MKTIIFAIGFALLQAALFAAPDFSDGVHFINKDNKSYTIVYSAYSLTTRICHCRKPTPTIKNGLAPAYERNAPKGFRIVSKKDGKKPGMVEITAVVEPHTSAFCLSASLASLEIKGLSKMKNLKDKTVVIHSGKVAVFADK
jgi:hypothetical protein